MPKVLFIQPTQHALSGELCKQKKLFFPGLAFPHLAAFTPKNWEVEINLEVIEDIDFETDAELIGIGGMGHALFRGIEIAKEFKKRNKKVFFGGYMASLFSDYVKPFADSIIIGDGEISYPLLLKDYEGGSLKKVYSHPIENLENFPIPRYELIASKNIGPMLPVQAGRGCPHTCRYCSIASLYRGKYLPRPVDDVIRDIKRIQELGYKEFYMIDDNIIGDKEYFEELCNKLIPLKMRWSSQCSLHIAKNPHLLRLAYESGCRILSFGIESINQKGLTKLGKSWIKVKEYKDLLRKVSKVGILVSTEMLFGLDGDTKESIEQTYKFVMDQQIPVPKFYILTPIPGTMLFHDYKKNKKLLHEEYTKYTGTNCVHKISSIDSKELNQRYRWIVNKVFSYTSILKRTIFNRDFFKDPLLYLFAFGINLHYRKYVKNGEAPNIF